MTPAPRATVEFRDVNTQIDGEAALLYTSSVSVLGGVPREDEEVVIELPRGAREGTVYNVQWILAAEGAPQVVVYVDLD